MTDVRNDPELAEVFRAEVGEMLDAFAGLLEHIATSDGEARARDVHAAFRIMHNMKGAATVFGATPIAKLAHAVEDALGALRKAAAGPSSKDVAVLAETIPLFEGLAAGTVDEQAVKAVIDHIEEICEAGATAPRPPTPIPATPIESAPKSMAIPHPDHGQLAGDSHASDAFVRVDVQRLDRLLARVGELLPLQSHFIAFTEEIDSILQSLSNLDEPRRRLSNLLRNHTAQTHLLSRVIDDVVDMTKRVRMIPLSTQVPHWNRLVRDAARTLGKHVDLEVSVEDIELDKRVFDSLRDPFFHLLRNSVDHGIEAPMMRQVQRKFEVGRILITARMTGTMVEIDISDDGAGIDAESVRDKALSLGLITADQAATMSWDEAAALIFLPGLSTARAVSSMSGRGVGLDAVRQVVRELGGSVDIVEPALGGTTFRIRVPVTIALLRGLLVRSENHPMVLPIEHVVHVRRVKGENIRRVEAMCVLDAGNESIPLHWPEAAARLGKLKPTDILNVVVLTNGTSRVGFVVDAVIAEQQFITRSLPWNLKSVPGVSGVVFLPDGTVSSVLDVSRFFDGGQVSLPPVSTAKTDGPARVLVVDDSMSIRTMMRNALESAGYQVFVCADGHDAWETLNAREIDLLVSDVRMPRVDGLELTRRVRADPRLAHLPIVLVTSLDREEDLVAGANAGANEYIVKSELNQSKLLEAVTRLT